MNYNFKTEYSSSARWSEATNIVNKYPDRVPVICERSRSSSRDCPFIDKKKYMVPRNLTVGQFMYVIRNRLNLPSDKSIFLLINGFIPSSFQSFGLIYELHKDTDCFLYVSYSFENTFGK
jgi:GABA(A) receptor-associated protein